MQHVSLGIVLQLLVLRTTGSWFGGAATASAWAISREITQAEYRWIETFGHHVRANMPWWGGLDPAVWQKLDPWVDWLAPTIVTFSLAVAVHIGRAHQLTTVRPAGQTDHEVQPGNS